MADAEHNTHTFPFPEEALYGGDFGLGNRQERSRYDQGIHLSSQDPVRDLPFARLDAQALSLKEAEESGQIRGPVLSHAVSSSFPYYSTSPRVS